VEEMAMFGRFFNRLLVMWMRTETDSAAKLKQYWVEMSTYGMR
jgi:hypothetical protein